MNDPAVRQNEPTQRQSALDAVRLMVIQLDGAGQVVYVNRFFCDFVGINPDDFYGKDFFARFLHDGDSLRQLFDLYLAADASFAQRETELITPSGLRRVLWSAWAHRDASGQVIGVLAVGEDQTNPSLGQRDARHRQAAFLTIADYLPNGFIYQFQTRPDGRRGFTFLSAGAAAIYELPTATLVEDSDRRLKLIHPDDRQRLLDLTNASMRQLSVFDAEYRIRTEAGRQKWLHLRAQPRRLPDGSFLWDGVGLDVTARMQAEKEGHRLRQLLDGICKSQASFIDEGHPKRSFEHLLASLLAVTESEYGFIGEVLHDPAGQPYARMITYTSLDWNEHWQEWYERNLPAGAEFRRLDTLIGAVLSGQRAVLSNAPASDARSGGFPAGHPPLHAFLGIPFFSKGELVGLAGIANRRGGYEMATVDFLEPFSACCAGLISARRNEALLRAAKEKAEDDRRQLERKMQETQRLEALGVLAGGIAHDFNNLMTSVLGYSSLAEAEVPAESHVQSYLQAIVQAARQSADLCQQMLAYAGKGRVAMTPVDLNSVVRDTARLLQVSLPKAASLSLQLSSQPAVLLADANQLRQVAMNLILNAAESLGDAGGAIVVTTAIEVVDRERLRHMLCGDDLQAGKYVSFDVADTGCGMEAETVGHIFEPFYSTKFSGRGLGLAAVLGIVRGHRGAIAVESQVGRGTVFRLLFAALPETAPEDPASAIAGAIEPRGRALLVEDEEAVRRMAGRLLESIGFEVAAFADGPAALDALQRGQSFDIAIVDLSMPVMNGTQTAATLREITPSLPILLISGHVYGDAGELIEAGKFDGFLQKPFGKADLAQAIAAIRNGC